ncbi:MAG: YfhO family protein [Lachnospira sp.]
MNIKKILKNVLRYAFPGMITLAAASVILIIKGIWPFGSERIVFFDNMQQVAPLYCHLWDWMHGKASLWFDWYTGLGTNVSMSISAFSMLTPFNLILYFVPRSYILEFLTVLTMIKMECMAVSMFALLNYKYKKMGYGMKVTLAVMYSFSGYVLAYSSCFTPWMDIVALFPLLIMACDHLVKTGKKLFYVIMTGLFFIINYYLGAMSLIYVFMYVGIRLFTDISKDKRKSVCWSIGIGTASGISLSAFVLVPVFMQLMTSQRNAAGSGNKSIVQQYLSWIRSATMRGVGLGAFQRMIMLFGMALFIVIIICGLIKYNYKTDKKNFIFNISMLVLVLAPVFCEGTNLFWHFGSYNGYTLRNGYMVAFTILFLAAGYIEKMYSKAEGKIRLPALTAVAACVIYTLVYQWLPISTEKSAFWVIVAEMLVMLIFYSVVFVIKKNRVNVRALMCITGAELFFAAFALIGTPKFYEFSPYQYGDYVQLTNQVKEELDITESATDRIVNPDISLNANYPLILSRGAQSSFTAALLADTQDYSVNWGYSKYFLWLLDSGGTVFTNSLYHVTEAVNRNPLDEKLYTLERESGDYKLYSANYQLPFGMYVDSSLIGKDLSEAGWIDLHNAFYKAMSGDSENIARPYYAKPVKQDNGNAEEYTVYVNGKNALYIQIDDRNNKTGRDSNATDIFHNVNISINGEKVLVPTLGDTNNTDYATDYNNKLIYLGIFEDEEITVRVDYLDEDAKRAARVRMGGIDMNKLDELCQSYRENEQCEVSNTSSSVTVRVSGNGANESADGNGYLIIPVIYNEDNWTVTVNGRESEAYNVAGMFTLVKLDAGDNEVVLTFDAKGRNIGFLITIIGIIIIVVYKTIKHFRKVKAPVWCEKCAEVIYLVLFAGLALTLIIIPVVASVPANIIAVIKAL